MATVEVAKAVDRLPPIIAACNTKALESLESVEAVNPPEEAPAAAAKDIAHMNISENPGTPQKTEGSEEQKAKEHEDQVQFTVPRRTGSIRLTEHPETSQQTIEQLASKFEGQKTLPPSTEKLPKTESPTKQDSQQDLKVVKKAAVEKDDESSSSSSSSEDEKEKPKDEKKHSLGLSQAISSGLAGATAGIASTLTGNATSAVLAAMHRTIGNKKPTSTHDKGAKPSEKSDNTKPNATAIATITVQDMVGEHHTATKAQKVPIANIHAILPPVASIQKVHTMNAHIPIAYTRILLPYIHTTIDTHMDRMTILRNHPRDLPTSQSIHIVIITTRGIALVVN
ncbi:hypothetical protein L207DRAFT_579725 [Hyaloscypha variabilis F]|uniref:Uncharacterized protein n=1 Tax=Hyaloscypha variabilis (strain UAMH 11265 / GT02V1 / F) TaxID=1149755 RepID=A0A2J6S231_HYAVF|nr:hypothetical protein L207DRAFT_579725 [Hyaloscypha variabilis F]